MSKNGNSQVHIRPNQLPLPKATRFPSITQTQANIGLLFERYTRFQSNWELGNSNKKSSKQWLLEQLTKCNSDDNLRKSFVARWQKTVAPGKTWQMTPTWRFVTGMGNKTALEVGFTFHRIYGFPYIPSSSLKGLARAVALIEIAQQANIEIIGLKEAQQLIENNHATPLQKLEEALLQTNDPATKPEQRYPSALRQIAAAQFEHIYPLAEQFRAVFGTPDQVGQAIFHDALPAAKPTLQVDVMTPHYPNYYQGDEPPTDTQDPIPIPFLTLGQTPFHFAVDWHGQPNDATYHKAIAWLKFGLTEFGAGAKTAAGYGYFTER